LLKLLQPNFPQVFQPGSSRTSMRLIAVICEQASQPFFTATRLEWLPMQPRREPDALFKLE
jgi:hypothetical protein